MFSFYNKHNNSLYNKLVELSRNIFFYKELGLPDKLETRIMLVFLHFSLILIILKKKGIKFNQKIYDNIFQNIEFNMRELGHGDVSVNSKMKLLNKIFYDILLKLEVKNSKDFELNKDIIIKHLFAELSYNDQVISKISLYFTNFYNFCFELNYNIMLKGQINFKI